MDCRTAVRGEVRFAALWHHAQRVCVAQQRNHPRRLQHPSQVFVVSSLSLFLNTSANTVMLFSILPNTGTLVAGMKDGSFEENLWDVKSTNMANKPLCTRKEELAEMGSASAAAADGERYLWFGGYDFYFTQSATLSQQRIPRDATHIALFVSENAPTSGKWRSSLFLRVDGTQVLHIDHATQQSFTAVYRNVDADIRAFADDKEHTLELFFNADEVSNSVSIFVDYLRFIRDDTCLPLPLFMTNTMIIT